jgi:alpha-D-ribose 1-methylphosphonate 5-triphosphate synthase subunit PhnH
MDSLESQAIFRMILYAMARPGKIVNLPNFKIDPPVGSKASLDSKYPFLVLFTFLDSYVRFKVLDRKNSIDATDVSTYVSTHTGSREAPIEEADFILIYGGSSKGLVSRMKRGSLKYPNESATLIYGVEFLGEGSLHLTLSGPGVPSVCELDLEGVEMDEMRDLIRANSEFPLGLDVIFSDKDGKAACLPRSTVVRC